MSLFSMKHKQGYTIMEILVVGVIVAIIISAITTFHQVISTYISDLRERHRAIDIAISEMEDLETIARSNFDDTKLTEGAHNKTDSNITLPEGFDIGYTVANRYDWPEDGTLVSEPPDTTIDYKEINVTCTYKTDKSIQFKTYLIKR